MTVVSMEVIKNCDRELASQGIPISATELVDLVLFETPLGSTSAKAALYVGVMLGKGDGKSLVRQLLTYQSARDRIEKWFPGFIDKFESGK